MTPRADPDRLPSGILGGLRGFADSLVVLPSYSRHELQGLHTFLSDFMRRWEQLTQPESSCLPISDHFSG